MLSYEVTLTGQDKLNATLVTLKGKLPKAQVIAVNRTALDILTETGRMIRANFVVRRPEFVLPPNLLPREMRATEQTLSARVNLGMGGVQKIGEKRMAILAPFETGTPKTAAPVAIPTSYLRPSFSQSVRQQYYPRYLVGQYANTGQYLGLGSKARVATRTSKAKGQVKGQAVGRFFVLGNSSLPTWGVYERTGPGTIRKLWNYRRSVPRPQRLSFYDTAQRTFVANWRTNFDVAIRAVLHDPTLNW